MTLYKKIILIKMEKNNIFFLDSRKPHLPRKRTLLTQVRE